MPAFTKRGFLDQQKLTPYTVLQAIPRIALTSELAQNAVYHNAQTENHEVKMPVKNSFRGRNTQVHFRINEAKEVVGTMDGPQISSFGGLVLLGELEKTFGLICAAARSLKDWRAFPRYSLYRLLLQRVLLICAGLEDGIDSNYHRYDPAVLVALGLNVSTDSLASQPTISIMENKMDSKNCYRLAMCLLQFYIQSRGTVPKEIILDFDGSCFPVHGRQQGSCYRGHYETDMYFPLLVFDQDGWLITAILRPGTHGEARIVIPVLKRIVAALRAAWPAVRIIVRADAGFNDPKIYDWCEDQGRDDPRNAVYYLIRIKRAPADGNGMDVYVKHIKAIAKRTFRRRFGPEKYLGEEGKKEKHRDETLILRQSKGDRRKDLRHQESRTVRMFGDFEYQAGQGRKKWREDRRIIAVIDHSDLGGEQLFVVTNIDGEPPNYLYEQRYCNRGKAEGYIRELKSLRATRLSCEQFWANQFRLLEHCLAYQLLFKLRELMPPAQARMSLGSIRDNIIKVAVIVRESARKIVLQWTSHYFWWRQFLQTACHLQCIPLRV